MKIAYRSIHLGQKIDNFDTRITALETTTTTHTTQITDLENLKVNKTGGILENSCWMVDPQVDITPSANYWGMGYYIRGADLNNGHIHLRCVSLASGEKGAQMEIYRPVNGTDYYNQLRLMINNSGVKSIALNGLAWCKALSIPKILRGNVSVSNGLGSVTFSSAFGAAPTVITSPVGTGTDDYSTHPGSVTAGGCQMFGTTEVGSGAVGQATYTVNWIAIGTWP